ncbi:hypothetical protein BV200P1_00020 [Phocaeicola phage BV200P1]|nr:hypothetical protein BV200P1_00020 [Phocaeicola phage BV200P1]
MKITYINTGNSVGNQTDYTAPTVIPIAAGLKQELLFEGMENIAYMAIEVSRNGTPVHNQRLTPSSTMRIDLSTFAQVLPSLNELYKYLAGDPPSNVQDKIQFALLDGVTLRTYSFYVCSLNCPYLNSRGWVHHDEQNLVSSALASIVDPSLTVLGSGTAEAVTSSVFGTGAKIKGPSGWIANLPSSGFSVATGVEVTMSIYVENVGPAGFNLIFNFEELQEIHERIPVGFRGRVSKSFKRTGPTGYAPYIHMHSIDGKPAEANFYCFMMNYGNEPKPWVRSWADAASPCVGAMTDYRSGKTFNPYQISRGHSLTANLDLTGYRKENGIYYPVWADASKKSLYWEGGTFDLRTGTKIGETEVSLRIVNPNGTTYGWYERENKLPKDVSPNCGVHLRWLNSRGWYDDMFFEKYSIKPVMRTNNSGGNGIDYYETTVQIDVNWDNEPCLNWIQRSSDIIARIPIDVCQFGRATLLATNVFQTQGGNKTKTIQFKFKVQIVEP